jgi:hypothetical protein
MTTEKRIVLTMSEKEAKSLERVLNTMWYNTNWDHERKTYKGDVEISEEDREFAVIAKKVIGKEVRSC